MESRTVRPVVHLARFRNARRAAEALVGLLHGASFVLKVAVEVLRDGEPVVVALVSHNSQAIRAALPRSMDGVRVRVRNVRASRKAP